MKEYIDVRGPVPIYFRGAKFYRLFGCNRDITVQDARTFIMGYAQIDEYFDVCIK